MNRMVIRFIVMILLMLNAGGTRAYGMEVSGKKILYLATGKPTQRNTQELVAGFVSKAGVDNEVYIEYLGNIGGELGKFPPEIKDNIEELMRLQIEMHGDIDMIVCAGDVAAGVLLDSLSVNQGKDIFLLNVSDEEIIKKAKEHGVGMVVRQENLLKENIQLVYDLYGNKRNITVLTGPEVCNKKLIDEFKIIKDKSKSYGLEMDMISLPYANKGEIEQVLDTLDHREDVVLLMNPMSELFSSSHGINIKESELYKSVSDVMREVPKHNNIPVYTNMYAAVKDGLYGGRAIDLYNQGKYYAQKVLNYDDASGTILMDNSLINKTSINVHKVLSSGVGYENIPPGVEMLSSNYVGVYQYEKHIIGLFVVMFILLLVVIYITYKLDSEKKRAQEFSELRNKAEQLNKMKDKFISNISHELRTPVTVITSSTQMMKMIYKNELEMCGGLRNNINVVEKNAYRLIRLINNVIDVSRTESEYMTIDRENIEVIGFIEDIVLSVAPYAKEKGLKVIFDTEMEELFMAVDTDKLDRIILNLLSNALKFTSEGEIFVWVESKENALLLRVTDTGCGIEKDKIEIIFDKFTQIDTGFTRMNEGSGIGLSVVKSFVDLHEGQVGVKSEIGKGTTIEVSIPIQFMEENEVMHTVYRNAMNTVSELSDIYM